MSGYNLWQNSNSPEMGLGSKFLFWPDGQKCYGIQKRKLDERIFVEADDKFPVSIRIWLGDIYISTVILQGSW